MSAGRPVGSYCVVRQTHHELGTSWVVAPPSKVAVSCGDATSTAERGQAPQAPRVHQRSCRCSSPCAHSAPRRPALAPPPRPRSHAAARRGCACGRTDAAPDIPPPGAPSPGPASRPRRRRRARSAAAGAAARRVSDPAARARSARAPPAPPRHGVGQRRDRSRGRKRILAVPSLAWRFAISSR